jgi:MFS family permease
VLAWGVVGDSLPIYPLYALLFTGHGLSGAQISALFAVWSLAGLVANLPAGVLADRWSRRGCLVLTGPVQGCGYLLWLHDKFAWYAAGFALWGVAGALTSGAFEALLFDGLTTYGEQASYLRVNARITASALLCQLVAAAGATLLFPYGGYAGVVGVSVGLCLLASLLAALLPEPPRVEQSVDVAPRFVRSVVVDRRLLLLVVAAAAVTGLNTLDEYFGLMAQAWGVPVALNPAATVGIPVAGGLGALVAGRLRRTDGALPPLLLVAGGTALVVAAAAHRPAGLVAVAMFYAAYQLVAVSSGTLVQQRIPSVYRATVTSAVAVVEEFFVFVVYGVWALGGALLSALAVLAVAPLLGVALRGPQRPGGPAT